MIMQQWMITVGIFVSYLIAMIVFKVAPDSATGRATGGSSSGWARPRHHRTGAAHPDAGVAPMADAATGATATRRRRSKSSAWTSPRTQVRGDRRGTRPRSSARLAREVAVDTGRAGARSIVVCIFFVFQQITGINVPFYYGPALLGEYFQSGNRRSTRRSPASRSTTILARGQRGRDLLRVPLHRQGRPAQARDRRLRRHGRVLAGRRVRRRRTDRHRRGSGSS